MQARLLCLEPAKSQQVYKREFSWLSCISFAVSIPGLFASVAITFVYPLEAGGAASAARIRTVTLGNNFTVRIFCQVPFCRCKISGLELVFSVIDLDFKAVDQLISVKPLHESKAISEQSTS